MTRDEKINFIGRVVSGEVNRLSDDDMVVMNELSMDVGDDFSVAVLASNFRPLVSTHSFLPNFLSCSPTTSPNLFLLLCLQVLAFLKNVLGLLNISILSGYITTKYKLIII